MTYWLAYSAGRLSKAYAAHCLRAKDVSLRTGRADLPPAS
jgi:hypothetical protein